MQDSKSSWPELNGSEVDKAVETIKSENNSLKVQKVPNGSMKTKDYRTNRVRVIYDTQTNLVSGTPKTG